MAFLCGQNLGNTKEKAPGTTVTEWDKTESLLCMPGVLFSESTSSISYNVQKTYSSKVFSMKNVNSLCYTAFYCGDPIDFIYLISVAYSSLPALYASSFSFLKDKVGWSARRQQAWKIKVPKDITSRVMWMVHNGGLK